MRTLIVLVLAMLVCACGSGGDDFDPASARVIIVSGDGQATSVPAPEVAGTVVRASVAASGHLLPEPLVVRVVDQAPAASLVGPSAAVVPAGTPLHWRVQEDGCGEPFGATTMTDDTAYSINRIVLGTVARDCTAEVGRILGDGTVVIDSVFSYMLTPGPAYWSMFRHRTGYSVFDFSPYLLDPCFVRDTFGNPVPYTLSIASYAHVDSTGSIVADSVGTTIADVLVADTIYALVDVEVSAAASGFLVALRTGSRYRDEHWNESGPPCTAP